ncbi:MAG: OmpH family outer membrane protein [Rikenellaceae bacterium]|nr:OmpH family outer membrane protein [Rikenellaceae bacterium]
MKKILFLTVALVGLSVAANAQSVKVARVNTQDVMASLPEVDSARIKLESFAKDLQDELETMQVEYNNKLESYNKAKATMTPVIASQKERDLNDLARRIQERSQTAQEDYSNVQMSLMQPIIGKVEESIKKIAKTLAITVVFDAQDGPVYIDENTPDITNNVIKDLGGTPKAQ